MDHIVYRVIDAARIVDFGGHRGVYTRQIQHAAESIVEQPKLEKMTALVDLLALPALLTSCRLTVLFISTAILSLTACTVGPSPVVVQSATSMPAIPTVTMSATRISAPATPDATAATSPRTSHTTEAASSGTEAHLAWPACLPEGQVIQADRSTITPDQLRLELANPSNAQDYIIITSDPDSGEGFGPPCTETVTVRGLSGVSCTTGGGTTVRWVEKGWRYSIGGALMSAEQAIAIAETLEFIDIAMAQEHLNR